jgi:broad specificity phosphatase PhoE
VNNKKTFKERHSSAERRLKEIVLIRHGKPASAHNQKINASAYAQWVRRYNLSSLDPQSKPTVLVPLVDSYIIVSSLKRASLSASAYGAVNIDEVQPLLREMDIPYYRLPFSMKAWHWVLVSRLLWFLGKKGKFESFKAAKSRVVLLADHLESILRSESRVVLFGHGLIHYFLQRQLKKRGWLLVEKNSEFWGVSRLIK